jgi:hypothetical protein
MGVEYGRFPLIGGVVAPSLDDGARFVLGSTLSASGRQMQRGGRSISQSVRQHCAQSRLFGNIKSMPETGRSALELYSETRAF